MAARPSVSDMVQAEQLYQQFLEDVSIHRAADTLKYKAPARSVRQTWQRTLKLAFPSAVIEVQDLEQSDSFNTAIRFESGDVLKLAIFLDRKSSEPLKVVGAFRDFLWSAYSACDFPETLPMFIAKLDRFNLLQKAAYTLNRAYPNDDGNFDAGLVKFTVQDEREVTWLHAHIFVQKEVGKEHAASVLRRIRGLERPEPVGQAEFVDVFASSAFYLTEASEWKDD